MGKELMIIEFDYEKEEQANYIDKIEEEVIERGMRKAFCELNSQIYLKKNEK